jgi:hypothetical protein
MRTFFGLLLVLAGLATAQFQFFEQFFQGGQQPQGQQEKQNVPSDSSWYRQNWEGGQYIRPFDRGCCDGNFYSSIGDVAVPASHFFNCRRRVLTGHGS